MSEATDVAAAFPPKSSPLIPILLGINCLALVAVLVVVLTRGSGAAAAGKPAEDHGAAAEVNKPGPTIHLSDFTARLHGEGDRYARLSLEIEVANDKEKEEMNGHVPQIRDSFISLLADSTLDDLNGSDGIAKLKERLRARLVELVPEPKIRGLYITDLVVQ